MLTSGRHTAPCLRLSLKTPPGCCTRELNNGMERGPQAQGPTLGGKKAARAQWNLGT